MTTQSRTAYITIGNTDHKLSQPQWAAFYADVDNEIRFRAQDSGPVIYFAGTSQNNSPYQNACWCVELPVGGPVARLKRALSLIARTYGQESIAWAEVIDVEFIKPYEKDA